MLNQSDLKQFANLSRLSEERVERLCKNGKIERRLAENLISYSTFWDHPSGDFVLAKGHFKKIYISKDPFSDEIESEEVQSLFSDRLIKMNCWAIEFGYNTFMICRAVHNFQDFILQKIQEKEREIQNISELIEATFDEATYSFGGGKSYYSGSSYLQFGSTFVDKVSFVKHLFKMCSPSESSQKNTSSFSGKNTKQGRKRYQKVSSPRKEYLYRCNICSEQFQTVQEFYMHRIRKHKHL